MKSVSTFALSLALLTSAPAAVVNGNFASPLSTGWTTLGDVSIQSGAAFLTTSTVLDQDDPPAPAGTFNFSAAPAVETGIPGGPEEFAGLATGDLDPEPGAGNFAFEGSVMKQTFNVPAGEFLTFDWQILTNDDANDDYAFITINGVLTVLGTQAVATTGSTPFARESVTSTFSRGFPSAGPVTLAFGIVDTGDFNTTSALRVDNVALVPEPSATILATLLAAGLLVRRRRL